MINPEQFKVGMEIWVLVGDYIQVKKPETRIVKEILSPRKGILLNGDKEELWRLEEVYATKEEAEESWRKQVVILTWDHSDADLVLYALCRRLRDVEKDLALLRIANERELTRSERAMLPSQLFRFSREELQEQINPWDFLQDHIIYLIRQIREQMEIENDH